jgi:glycosyltransferase involved in cell wall biosynthesis
MVSVVVPVKNEEDGIAKTLDNCRELPVKDIIIVVNGCTDNSLDVIENHPLRKKFHIIQFSQPLGIDVPRAVGAAYAYKNNSSIVLFLDGDMQGNIAEHLIQLIDAVRYGNIDMALTNCYPYLTVKHCIAATVLRYRENIKTTPWRAFAIPPLSLAIAVENQLKVKIATSIPHNMLLSPLRNDDHSVFIAETIIGDCLEALCHIEGLPPSREDNGIFYLGYHPERKFGILEEYVRGLGI